MPEFLTAICLDSLEVSTACLPKVSLDGLVASLGGAPVPFRLTDACPTEEFTENTATFLPATSGVNKIDTLQDEPASKGDPQLLSWLKSALSIPVMETEFTVSMLWPLFSTSTSRGVLVVSVPWEGKLMDLGLSLSSDWADTAAGRVAATKKKPINNEDFT